MSRLYFAYGSNLHAGRMAERVPGSRALAVARLAGHRLVCDKAGADGSAKANLADDPRDEVWGVVYELAPDGLQRLDPFEGGYRRIELRVETLAGESLSVISYRSERRTEDPRPFDWYLELIVEGARAHGLPEAWVARVAAWPSRPDPLGERGRGGRPR